MTKHKHYFVSIAVLLLMTALVTGCAPAIPEQSAYQSAPGKGAVRLNFAKEVAARTIMPGTDIDDFHHFVLDFTVSASPGLGTPKLNYAIDNSNPANRTVPIDLDVGFYDLTVIGYMSAGATENAAIFTKTDIEVELDDSTPVNIILEPYTPATNPTLSGTFDWTITGIAAIDSGTLTVTSITGGGAVVNIPNIKSVSSDTASLLEGYYFVDVTAVKGSTTISLRHILHIYRFMTSTWEYQLRGNQFGIIQGVEGTWEYEQDDNTPVLMAGAVASMTFSHTLTGTPTVITVSANNSKDKPVSFTSLNWYCNSTTAFSTSTTSYTLNDTAPFDKAGVYDVTVIGYVGSVPYATLITITIIDE
jgi:hypothetical protein